MRTSLFLAAFLCLPLAAHVESPEATEKDELVIEGIGLSRDIPCEGRNIGIYGADNSITLTGHCLSVIVHGSGHQVSLENAVGLTVSGADHTVFAEAVANLQAETSGHVITANMSASSVPAQVAINGVDHTLNLTLKTPTDIAVDGTEQVVNWSLDEGIREPRIEIGGIENIVNRIQ